MDPTTLARWQFATTTVYHFLIVPISIGLTALVAVMQTKAYRRRGTAGEEVWDRSARFWGRIMLVLFALGVVTGIVQEFQFGMNWSAYSRFVGDIFGAPLAMEALIAFFLESTFLGLWIFGRGILSPKVHLATIWLAAAGTTISAYFILAANSFMQHPVGLTYNAAKNRVELTSIWKVLTNSTQLVTFPHTILAAFMTASALLVTVSAHHLRKDREAADPVHRGVAKLGIGVLIVAAVGVSLVGHVQGQIMTKQQPMKMAAAEALWDTKTNASFSLLAYANVEQGRNKIDISIPGGLSLLATNSLDGKVEGINDIQKAETAKYGKGSYVPVVWMAYWMFRLMIGFGVLAALIAIFLAIQWRRDRLLQSQKLLRVATWTVALPLAANAFGWIFTETARQPWLVYGLLRTKDGVSTNVGTGFTLTTLVLFTVLYGVLGVICFRLVHRFATAGPDSPAAPPTERTDEPVLNLV
ncbi:MAG TPA: cytochrome ubiquinol oxidase subunit I [Jatrophihabitans sp.]|uniref:cytochrome ubiquinol oxidase subunit I n=1 Tax=Jatrophihabitans sp. TaxID=1932789 RepID=UPI002DF7E89C|nr:cytochrome ubiquinol oxidase subunit I [Jatrophihabitans sp.]